MRWLLGCLAPKTKRKVLIRPRGCGSRSWKALSAKPQCLTNYTVGGEGNLVRDVPASSYRPIGGDGLGHLDHQRGARNQAAFCLIQQLHQDVSVLAFDMAYTKMRSTLPLCRLEASKGIITEVTN